MFFLVWDGFRFGFRRLHSLSLGIGRFCWCRLTFTTTLLHIQIIFYFIDSCHVQMFCVIRHVIKKHHLIQEQHMSTGFKKDSIDIRRKQLIFMFRYLLELELDSLAISFTTLNHRFELFTRVSTRTSNSQFSDNDSPPPSPPKPLEESAGDGPCLARYFPPKP